MKTKEGIELELTDERIYIAVRMCCDKCSQKQVVQFSIHKDEILELLKAE